MTLRPGAPRHEDDSPLRAARVARALSQQQLATLAGVSRQAVAAVEARRSEPSLRVALALAESLGVSVEELFASSRRVATVAAVALGDLGGIGSRVDLAPVAGQVVAVPLTGGAGVRSGFSAAGGIVTGDPALVRPLSPIRPTVVVAGCDPALALLETPLAHLDPPVVLAWRSCGSAEALSLAASGLVHAAGLHVRDTASDEYNFAAARHLLGPAMPQVFGFASWRQGLVLDRRLWPAVTGIADVVRLGLRLVNREPGAEARTLLDRLCEQEAVDGSAITGYDTEVRGHLEVAASVAARLADVGVASEPAALAYGLDFLPLSVERFDLALTPRLSSSPETQALTRVLRSPWLHSQLASIAGYDPSPCGEEVAPS